MPLLNGPARSKLLISPVCSGSHGRDFGTLVMAGGFKRSEHLVTALRAAAWIWFARLGAHRPTFERYLGIYDRGNFRRACRRAGIEPPWKVLNSAV